MKEIILMEQDMVKEYYFISMKLRNIMENGKMIKKAVGGY